MPHHLVVEGRDPPRVGRHGMAREAPAQNLAQPAPLLGHRQVAHAVGRLLHLQELGPQPPAAAAGPQPPQQVRRVRGAAPAHARISRLRAAPPPPHSRLSRLSRRRAGMPGKSGSTRHRRPTRAVRSAALTGRRPPARSPPGRRSPRGRRAPWPPSRPRPRRRAPPAGPPPSAGACRPGAPWPPPPAAAPCRPRPPHRKAVRVTMSADGLAANPPFQTAECRSVQVSAFRRGCAKTPLARSARETCRRRSIPARIDRSDARSGGGSAIRLGAMAGGSWCVPPVWLCGPFQAWMAAISGPTPRMAITRFML
jgi:hypothetical protein